MNAMSFFKGAPERRSSTHKFLRFFTPLMLLATFSLWGYEALRKNPQRSDELLGGKFQISDLMFDIPPTQKIFMLDDKLVASDSTPRESRRAKSLGLTYRREGAPVEAAPGASVGVSLFQMDRAMARDSWCINNPDRGKGGKYLKPEDARARTEAFYVYERNIKGQTLVAANSRTFFGAPVTLSRVNNEHPGGGGADDQYNYMTGAALSPQVMLIANFNDIALNDISIFDLLDAIEHDVRRWALLSSSPKRLGRQDTATCDEAP